MGVWFGVGCLVFLVVDFVGLVNCSLVGVLVSRVLWFGFRLGWYWLVLFCGMWYLLRGWFWIWCDVDFGFERFGFGLSVDAVQFACRGWWQFVLFGVVVGCFGFDCLFAGL